MKKKKTREKDTKTYNHHEFHIFQCCPSPSNHEVQELQIEKEGEPERRKGSASLAPRRRYIPKMDIYRRHAQTRTRAHTHTHTPTPHTHAHTHAKEILNFDRCGCVCVCACVCVRISINYIYRHGLLVSSSSAVHLMSPSGPVFLIHQNQKPGP